ncbi:MAG: hypothetical protein Q8N18_11450 [Opitutaceae bacterium]|nr:hypothetical protein [Opitutaceae bacterium]
MSLFERMANWSWPTRLAVSGVFLGVSTFLLIFANRFWPWGWLVGIVILLIPVFFREKHSEYQASDGEVWAHAEMVLGRAAFDRLLAEFSKKFPRSLAVERLNSILTRVSELKDGESAAFSLHLKNNDIESPFELAVRAGESDLLIRVRGRDEALSLLKEMTAKLGAHSSI